MLALLIRPVARICQYPLLFREVQKHMQQHLQGQRASVGGDNQRLASGAQFTKVAGEMLDTIDQINEKARRTHPRMPLHPVHALTSPYTPHISLHPLRLHTPCTLTPLSTPHTP